MNDQKNDAVEVVVNQMDDTKEPMQTVAETGAFQQRTSHRSSSITFLAILAVVLAVTSAIIYLVSNRRYENPSRQSTKGDVTVPSDLPSLPNLDLRDTNPIAYQTNLRDIIAYLDSQEYPDELFRDSRFQVVMTWTTRDPTHPWDVEKWLNPSEKLEEMIKAVKSGTFQTEELFDKLLEDQKFHDINPQKFQWTYRGRTTQFDDIIASWFRELSPPMSIQQSFLENTYRTTMARTQWGNPKSLIDPEPMSLDWLHNQDASPSDPVEQGISLNFLIKYLYVQEIDQFAVPVTKTMTETEFKETFTSHGKTFEEELDVVLGDSWADWLSDDEVEDRRVIRVCKSKFHWMSMKNYDQLLHKRCPLCNKDYPDFPGEIFEIVNG